LTTAKVLILNEIKSEDELRKVLTKLHKQFGHASAYKLSKLLENAGVRNGNISKLLLDVTENCDICLKYKRLPPKPVVGFPLASDFNETVAVDLHELDHSTYYLHIMDEFTRFSAGAIVCSKQSSVFVQKFLQNGECLWSS